MDLKGSLVDTCLRIYPTTKLITFLKKQKLRGNIPINIGKIALGESYKPEHEKEDKPKPNDSNLNNEEIKQIQCIKEKIKDIKDKQNENEANNATKSENNENFDTKSSDDHVVKQVDNLKEVESNMIKAVESIYGPHLTTSDIDWLYTYIQEEKSNGKDVPYLHDLLEGCHIELPENEVLKRNPVLEARCVKLRAQQEAREYRKMTKSVDNVRMKFPEDSISYQLKQVNRQLIAIGQFILSIFAGFLFGFKGVEWMVGNLDFGFRLLLGVMCALIIALAEIYFLAKKLNEELNVPETTQLGGPPKFVDETLNENRIRKDIVKPHQE